MSTFNPSATPADKMEEMTKEAKEALRQELPYPQGKPVVEVPVKRFDM